MTVPSPPNDPLKAAWLSQPVEHIQMSTMELAGAAGRFEKKVHRRNLIEYIAGAVVIPAFGAVFFFGHHGWIMRLGSAMAVLGVVFILWQLHRRASAGRLPSGASPENLLAFQRNELVRQRDALRSVPVWYLAPVVPSFIVLSLGRWIQDHNPKVSLAEDHVRIIIGGVIAALLLAIVWLLNALGAARLDREIDKIDRLQGT